MVVSVDLFQTILTHAIVFAAFGGDKVIAFDDQMALIANGQLFIIANLFGTVILDGDGLIEQMVDLILLWPQLFDPNLTLYWWYLAMKLANLLINMNIFLW